MWPWYRSRSRSHIRNYLPAEALEGQLNIYKEACAKAGNEPDILYLRPVYLGDDDAQIRREIESAVLNFLKFNASPIFSKPPLPPKEELIEKGYGFYASGALEGLAQMSYDEIVDQEIGYIGSPQKVIDQIGRLREKGGIGEVTILTNFGGIEHEKAIDTQKIFAEEVMPAFR